MIIQPVNISIQDSNTEANYAQMKEQQANNGVNTNDVQNNVKKNADSRLEEIKKEQLEEAKPDISKMNEALSKVSNMVNVYFQFEWDEENSKEMLLKIFNRETKEMIRQYPSEISLKIAQMLEKSLGSGRIADVKL